MFDSFDKIEEKCTVLSDWIKNAKHVVVHTGAGISTSAGAHIPFCILYNICLVSLGEFKY